MAQMAHLSKHAKSSAGFIVCLFLGVCGKKGNERYAFKAVTKDGRSLSGNIFDRDHLKPYENLIKILDTRFSKFCQYPFSKKSKKRLDGCYVLRVTGYVLRVTCYVLRVTCYVLRVTC